MPKLKSGLWWSPATRSHHFHVRRTGADGQVHDLKGDTCTADLAEAHRQKEAAIDAWRRQQAGLPARPKVATLRELHAAWSERNARALSARSLAFVEQRFRLHLGELLDLPADQITTDRVEAARSAYLAAAKIGSGTPRSLSGANKLAASLKQVLGWGVRAGRLRALPFALKPLKDEPRLPVVVWPEQVAAFLAPLAPKPLKSPRAAHLKSPGADLRRWDVHDLVLFGLSAGLREGECVAARWECVDWRRRLYTVTRTKTRRPREIPLEAGLEARLRIRWETSGRPTEGLIVTDPSGRPHRAQILRHPVERAGRALGLRGMTPHDLRRTFATALDELGFTLGQIGMLMGHKLESTTLLYIRRRPRPQAEAIEGLSRAYALVPQMCPEQPDGSSNSNKIKTKKSIPQVS